jgi:aspartate dehydrogenase
MPGMVDKKTRGAGLSMRIGLIGYGTIGRALSRAVRDGRAGDANLVAILGRDVDRMRKAGANEEQCKLTATPSEFFATEMDIAVEAAGHGALAQYAEEALLSGHDMLAVSVGALADEGLLTSIKRAATKSGRRLLIPSGALGGLDAISAGAVGAMDKVIITVRKPPAAWKGTPAEDATGGAGNEPVCFYEGRAREAVMLFPQNINVVAALSLSGVGFERTEIKMYADPAVQHNTFEILARGEFGELQLVLKNRPYPENPKTGYLVVMSLIKSIRRLQETVVVGF